MSLRKKVCGCAFAASFVWAVIPLAQGAVAVGAINCVEGNVTVDGRPAVADGSQAAVVVPGHVLQTGQGRAEILLTPGAFLRVAANSAVRMKAASDTSAQIELVRGEALLEATRVGGRNAIDVVDQGADARPQQPGLYLFNATQPAIVVYDGKVRVDDDRRVVSYGAGKELLLDAKSGLKPQKFDRSETDDIYAWSKQRADYDAQASENTVEALQAFQPLSEHDGGWHWNPWLETWAFVPSAHYQISPFGYGFYPLGMPFSRIPVFADFRH